MAYFVTDAAASRSRARTRLRLLLSVGPLGVALTGAGCASILGDNFTIGSGTVTGANDAGGDGTTSDGPVGPGMDAGSDAATDAGTDAPAPTVLLSCESFTPKTPVTIVGAIPPASQDSGGHGDSRLLSSFGLYHVGSGRSQKVRIIYGLPNASGNNGPYTITTLGNPGDTTPAVGPTYTSPYQAQVLSVHPVTNGLGILVMGSYQIDGGQYVNRLELHFLPNTDDGTGTGITVTQLAPDNFFTNGNLNARFAEAGNGTYFYVVTYADQTNTMYSLSIGLSTTGGAPPPLPTGVISGSPDRYDVSGDLLYVPNKYAIQYVAKNDNNGPGALVAFQFPVDAKSAGTMQSVLPTAFVLATAREVIAGVDAYDLGVGVISGATDQIAFRIGQVGGDKLGNLDITKLAAYPPATGDAGFGLADLPVNSGDAKWVNSEMFAIGGSADSTVPGLAFLYFDSNAGLRAKESKLLGDRPTTILYSAIDMNNRTLASFVTFDVAWLEQASPTTPAAILYDHLQCIAK